MLYTQLDNARHDPSNTTGIVYRVLGLDDGVVYVADGTPEYTDLIMRQGVFEGDNVLWVTSV